MILNTKALVLRSVNYSESSVVLTMYTSALGLRSYLVKGIRKQSSKGAGNIYQPLQLLDLVVQERHNKKLQFIKEAKIDRILPSLRFDMPKTAVGLFMLELIHSTVREIEPNPELFSFFEEQLISLDQERGNISNYHLQFMTGLAHQLGIRPLNNYDEQHLFFSIPEGLFVSSIDFNYNMVNEEDSKLFHDFLTQQEVPSREKRKRILSIYEQYFQYHIPEFRSFQTPNIFESLFH